MNSKTLTSIQIEKSYLVGGAVRDSLLDITVKDKDWVVVGSTPEEMIAAGFIQVGKDFPVFLHPKTKEEYALARKERKTGVGYQGFSFDIDEYVSLEDDLLRRDLTINAMAQNHQGEIIDPYKGQEDLNNKILRHVSPAFREDPLRVLRLARFHARYAHKGFQVAPETLEIMQDIVASEEILDLSKERLWQETAKALSEQTPRAFFETLDACGALQQIFPSLAQLKGVPQRKDYHPEIDTFVHVMMCLDSVTQLTNNIDVRFAVLVHDLGKGITPQREWPSHRGHEQTGLPLVKALCKQLKVPKKTQSLAMNVCEYHLLAHTGLQLTAKRVVKLFEDIGAYRDIENLHHWLMACEADAKGRLGFEDRDYPVKDYFLQAFEASRSINAKVFVEQGLEGKKIRQALNKARIHAVQVVKNTWQNTAMDK